MPYDFQVVVDSADPHTLADWWAETLEWPVEEQDESVIKDMVARGFATDDETMTHRGRLVWRTGAAIRHPEPFPGGKPRRVLFQHVPEAKTVKNRLHLDVWVGADQRDAARDALVARGATYLYSQSQGPHSWHTMADIEGNEFCIS
ncbi:VOC family protein [Actinoplanes subtropicus]|uniref:VOC family protein n=1 Tax=Actinoplanes subtropicus TaxID=543632 RepID=UPI0004C41280|nr:VOC family protein [Actinoplanes subtropicus]